MQVTVNGAQRTLPAAAASSPEAAASSAEAAAASPAAAAAPATVAQLIALLGLPASRIAIEHNGKIVARSARETTLVHAGDVFEIVTLVGGG